MAKTGLFSPTKKINFRQRFNRDHDLLMNHLYTLSIHNRIAR